jgi:ABC-type phosphate/phosphonate transport system substrate-binding protein
MSTMSADSVFKLGAVAYDPKVVTIWEGFKAWFAQQGFALDYVLFSGYEAQAEAHLAGVVDVTWDSPLAWVRTRRMAQAGGRRARSVAMRDTDQDLTSVVLVPAESAVSDVTGLRGLTVATGAKDSPQATLLPLAHLRESGLVAGRDIDIVRFDVMVAKHGDHIGGEREAVAALLEGRVQAACIIDGNFQAFAQQGVIPAGALRVLTRTGTYDHCTMTVLDDVDPARVDRFVELLMSMSYDDPAVRPLLQLEGLRQWRPGRTSGYRRLEAAVDALGLYGADGSIIDTEYAAVAYR